MEVTFILIMILAMLIESIVTTIAWVVDSKFNWQRVTALVVAMVLCWLASIDLFTAVGLPLKFPIVGMLLTGLILARGANFLNDLFRSFQTIGGIQKLPALSGTAITITNSAKTVPKV